MPDNNTNIGLGSPLKEFQLTTDIKSKLEPAFGEEISRKIMLTCTGVASYYYVRNARFKKNRDIANGQMDIDSMFRDRLEMNGKQNYINILFKSIIAETSCGFKFFELGLLSKSCIFSLVI